LAESGLPGFDTSAWFALLAPKQTPASVRKQIEQAAIAALNDPDAKSRLAAAGVGVAAGGADELQNRIVAETATWRDVIVKAGIKAQ
jgi:tripartite-type tricarboxylate transporter receptor subunit TctC